MSGGGGIVPVVYLLASGDLRPGWGVLAGATGGVAFLVVVWDALLGGVTRMRFLYVLGTAFAAHASNATARVIGLVVHLALSCLFGLVYAAVMTAVDVDSIGDAASLGLLTGAVHGLLAIPLIGWALSTTHPLVREGRVASPGPALTGYGRMTPLQWMVAHLAFGITVGAMYAAAVH